MHFRDALGRRNAEEKYKSHLKAFESKVHCDAVGTGTDQRHEMSKLPVDAQKMFRQSVKSVFATRVHKWLIFNHIL